MSDTITLEGYPELVSPSGNEFAHVSIGGVNYKIKLSNMGVGSGIPQLSTPTLTATVFSSTRIDLSWTNVANESSYKLEWSANGTSGWTQIGGTIAANTTTYSHTGLTPSTIYYYRVSAIGDGVTYTTSGFGSDSDTTSAGSSYDTDAQAYFTAAGITDIAIKNARNQVFLDLKAGGVYTDLDWFYFMDNADSAKNAVNAINPGTFDLTFIGTWTHGASGATPDGSTGYADTGFNPFTHRAQFSFSAGIYSRTSAGPGSGNDRMPLGVLASGSQISIDFYNGGGVDKVQACGTGAEFITENPRTSYTRTTQIVRTANNVFKAFRDGTQISTTNTNTITALQPNGNVYLGALNNGGSPAFFSNYETSVAYFGAGVDDTKTAVIKTAINTYCTTRGINV